MTVTTAVSGRVFECAFLAARRTGIRTVVFLKGCPLRCAWCANPESQRVALEVAWFENLCIGCGRCAAACRSAIVMGDGRTHRPTPCTACGDCIVACTRGARRLMGRDVTVDEVMAGYVATPLYRRSGGGVTFSGGEPFSQPEFLLECLRRSRRWGYHTTVETCGQASWEDIARAAEVTDLFLYDLKHLDTRKHKLLTGVGNEAIIENLERLLDLGADVTVRVPIIPDANDDEESIEALAAFVAAHPRLRRVELLPGHALGAHKYSALDLAPPPVETPGSERLEAMVARVAARAPGVSCVVTHGLV